MQKGAAAILWVPPEDISLIGKVTGKSGGYFGKPVENGRVDLPFHCRKVLRNLLRGAATDKRGRDAPLADKPAERAVGKRPAGIRRDRFHFINRCMNFFP